MNTLQNRIQARNPTNSVGNTTSNNSETPESPADDSSFISYGLNSRESQRRFSQGIVSRDSPSKATSRKARSNLNSPTTASNATNTNTNSGNYF